MIKTIVTLAIPLFLFSCGSGNGENVESNGKDFSKDEVVLEELSRITGRKHNMEDICIDRPKSFKGIELVGYFAHDRGCDGGMMFFNGKEVDINNDIPSILKHFGWEDKVKREVIALKWVKEISLHWSIPMESTDEDFEAQNDHTFMPPTVKTDGDEISVAIWVKQPPGMAREAYFHLQTIVFSIQEADFIRSQITDRFTVGYESE
jgi:hypothetical protein